ncbi:hypothetical protein KCU64_g20938, partial [Aureobasidium melanogenum]
MLAPMSFYSPHAQSPTCTLDAKHPSCCAKLPVHTSTTTSSTSSTNNLESHTMAGPSRPAGAHGGHPIHIHPVRPLYRFAATGLGASMW